MIITLTDPDGVRFQLDTVLIDQVTSGSPTQIKLVTGEAVSCLEDIVTVMHAAVQGYFGGGK